jgi:hypothetical protein
MQAGLRLAANFRAKLKKHKDEDIGEEKDIKAEPEKEGELSKEAKKILDKVRASYRNLVSGIARNRTLPAREGFIGDELIEDYSELVLTNQFIILEREEAAQFRQLEVLLEDIPIYREYLKHQHGIGPAMGGAIISRFNPHRAHHVSSFWKFAGLDVALDGRRRSRREEHLVEREYKDKKGKMKKKMGITYDPWVKTKMHILAASFIRLGSPWVEVYRGYKHRLETDPARIKITIEKWKEKNDSLEGMSSAEKQVIMNPYWPPGRIDAAARGYMVKMFLAELWDKWRRLEGLEVTPTYHEAIQGHRHGRNAAE